METVVGAVGQPAQRQRREAVAAVPPICVVLELTSAPVIVRLLPPSPPLGK